MNKLLFTGFTLLLFAVNGQKNSLFFDLNVGGRVGGAVTYYSKMLPGLHSDVGIGYMFSDVWGLKVDFGYDSFKATQDLNGTKSKDASYMLRGSVQAVVDLAEDHNFKNNKYGMLFHFGVGCSTINNAEYKDEYEASGGSFNDPYIKGNDDMGNVIFGLTPQLNLNENLALNLDFSTILFLKQSAYFDRTFSNESYKSLGAIWNLSVGLNYHIR